MIWRGTARDGREEKWCEAGFLNAQFYTKCAGLNVSLCSEKKKTKKEK